MLSAVNVPAPTNRPRDCEMSSLKACVPEVLQRGIGVSSDAGRETSRGGLAVEELALPDRSPTGGLSIVISRLPRVDVFP